MLESPLSLGAILAAGALSAAETVEKSQDYEIGLPSALDFDGASSYVDIGHDDLFDMTDQITVEAWFMQRELKIQGRAS